MDEKGGIKALEHTSRGYLGVLTYDVSAGTPENIPVLGKPISPEDLLFMNKRNFQHLSKSFNEDGLPESFIYEKRLNAESIFKNISKKSTVDMNKDYKDFLWFIQRDPIFPRSTTIVLSNMVNFPRSTIKEQEFHNDFWSQLQTKTYDSSNMSDRKAIIKAALFAYSKHEPHLNEKLKCLKNYNFTYIFSNETL